jgi:hypothetical protein
VRWPSLAGVRDPPALCRRGERLDPEAHGNDAQMVTEERKRCDNLACLCEVPVTLAVCGEYCASPEARDARTVACQCEHTGCKTETELRLHGGVGKESLS